MNHLEAAAREILGEHTPLALSEWEDGVLFSCENGYVLLTHSGDLLEYALSMADAGEVYQRREGYAARG